VIVNRAGETGHEHVRNDLIALLGATPGSAPDVSSLGGQIVRTANRDKTSDCNLIEYHRRLGQEYPQSQNSKTTKAAKEATTPKTSRMSDLELPTSL